MTIILFRSHRKSGLETVSRFYTARTKGQEIVYVDSLGKVIETETKKT